MADEPIQAPETPDTPAPEAPETDTPPVVNYEERYNSLRPEFDRKSQELAEINGILSDPEKLAAYWQEQGYGPDEDDDTLYEEAVDPYAETIQRLESQVSELTKTQEKALEQAEVAAEHDYISSEIDQIQEQFGEQLTDKEATLLGRLSQDNRDENGRPDVRKAYAEWTALIEDKRQSWVSTKKSPKVASGGSATEKINLDDPQARADYIDSKLADE